MNANGSARSVVAIVLAAGLSVAVICITVAILWEAVFSTGSAGISENATQILTTAFGGIIGVLGSYIGFKSGEKVATMPPPSPPMSSGGTNGGGEPGGVAPPGVGGDA